MADGNPVSFVLDLDNSAFLQKAQDALESIGNIGNSSDQLSRLVGKFGELAEGIGASGLIVEGFKTALDMTLEGEQIQQIETQFESLAAQAGVSGTELKEGLEKAAGGLVSTSDLLQIANKYMLQMGDSAGQLPAILELARKETVIYGGTVKDNFDEMTRAITMGNERWLKQHGIIVDTQAAVKAYADANGLAENELSKVGKQQAIMAAALEATKARFDGVQGSMGETTSALQGAKVAWQEFTEFLDVAVAQKLSPVFGDFFKNIAAGFNGLKEMMGGNEAADTAAKQAEKLETQIASLKARIDSIKESSGKKSWLPDIFSEDQLALMPKLESDLSGLQAKLEQVKKTKDAEAKDDDENTGKALANSAKRTAADNVNEEQRLKNIKAFEAEKVALEKATDAEMVKQINSVADIDTAISKKRQDIAKDYVTAVNKITADQALNAAQKGELIVAQEHKYQLQMQNFDRETLQLREQYNQQYLQNSEGAFQGIARAAVVSGEKAKAEFQDMGKFGSTVMSNLQTVSVNAFKQIGTAIAANQDVAKATAQAMEGAFLAMIGGIAEEQGGLLLLQGAGAIAIGDYGKGAEQIAAGGALIAFGAVVTAIASSLGASTTSSASAPGGGGGGGGGAATYNSGAAPLTTSQVASQQAPVQRSVNVNIQGNYLNTQESQRTLMEAMRSESDSTGFSYNTVGVGG